ncbi:MAG: DUF58 domain-containing protein [Acidobacteria bacterium]|nr:DUF58 domain-containing protein [Acidobacteriota bacterium]
MSFLGNIPFGKEAKDVADSLRRALSTGGETSSAAGFGGQRFLDPKVLSRISNLQLIAKTVVAGFVMGLHRSPQTGVSIDFTEYRPYSPGDDPRGVDWNVYARSDRHYLKKYRGETNTEVYLVVDASASMGYRSHNGHPVELSKFEYGCYLAASLAHFAIDQRDSAGLVLFDTEIRESIPSRSRRGQLLRILHALDRAKPGQGTDLAGALHSVRQFLHRRCMVVLISDFYEVPDKAMNAIRELQFGGNDLIVFHLLDPAELHFTLQTPAVLEDSETGESMEIIPEAVAGQYRKLLEEHITALGQQCRSSRIDYQLLDTGQPLDYALFTYLAARHRRP